MENIKILYMQLDIFGTKMKKKEAIFFNDNRENDIYV